MSERPTRERILDAAIAEFARSGFSGARIDRIATAAQANKERIYAYFGDKEGLFREVMSALAAQVQAWLPQSAGDLPHATGDLFDVAFSNPVLMRLLAWRRLETPEIVESEHERAELVRKLDDIRAAQAAGLIDPAWDPADLLAIVGALAGSWASAPGSLTRLAESAGPGVRDRRAAVEEAVRRIVAPGAASTRS